MAWKFLMTFLIIILFSCGLCGLVAEEIAMRSKYLRVFAICTIIIPILGVLVSLICMVWSL